MNLRKISRSFAFLAAISVMNACSDSKVATPAASENSKQFSEKEIRQDFKASSLAERGLDNVGIGFRKEVFFVGNGLKGIRYVFDNDYYETKLKQGMLRSVSNEDRVKALNAFIASRNTLLTKYKGQIKITKNDGTQVVRSIKDEDRTELMAQRNLAQNLLKHFYNVIKHRMA